MKKGSYVFLGILLPIAAIITGTIFYIKKAPAPEPEPLTAEIKYEGEYEIKKYVDPYTEEETEDVLHLKCSITNINKETIKYIQLYKVEVKHFTYGTIAKMDYKEKGQCSERLNISRLAKFTFELLFEKYDEKTGNGYLPEHFTEELDTLSIVSTLTVNPVPAKCGLLFSFYTAEIVEDDEGDKYLSAKIYLTNDTGVYVKKVMISSFKLFNRTETTSTIVADSGDFDDIEVNLAKGSAKMITLLFKEGGYDGTFWSSYDDSKVIDSSCLYDFTY